MVALVALVVVQRSVADWPLSMIVGLAEKVAVGRGVGFLPVTVTESSRAPRLPLE